MVVLGLGSNVGNRQAMLDTALTLLSVFISPMLASNRYETPALLPAGAPPEWDMPFVNMAVCGECTLTPLELLAAIKQIEQHLGRQDRGVWAPREIDIDILAMDDVVLQSEALCVPHPHLLTRDFALRPLAEIAPNWCYPMQGEHYGKTARELVTIL